MKIYQPFAKQEVKISVNGPTNQLSPQRLRRDFCGKERCMWPYSLFSRRRIVETSVYSFFTLNRDLTDSQAALPKRERGLAHRPALRQQGPWATFQVSRMPIQRDTGQSNSK